jgi:hypothetical protein
MGEVIREAFFNEMVFFQRTECVLKDRFLGTTAQSAGKFSDVAGPLLFDKKQMRCGFEFKRIGCPPRSFNRHIALLAVIGSMISVKKWDAGTPNTVLYIVV